MNKLKNPEENVDGRYTVAPSEKITLPEMKRIKRVSEETAASVREIGPTKETDAEKQRIALGKTLTSISQKMEKVKQKKTALSPEVQRIGLLLRPYFRKGYQNLNEREFAEASRLARRLRELWKDEE